MKNSFQKDTQLVRELVATARRLADDTERDEEDDPKMSEKLRNLKTLLSKLNQKRNKSLRQMGMQKPIKLDTTVEELVDMLTNMVTTGG